MQRCNKGLNSHQTKGDCSASQHKSHRISNGCVIARGYSNSKCCACMQFLPLIALPGLLPAQHQGHHRVLAGWQRVWSKPLQLQWRQSCLPGQFLALLVPGALHLHQLSSSKGLLCIGLPAAPQCNITACLVHDTNLYISADAHRPLCKLICKPTKVLIIFAVCLSDWLNADLNSSVMTDRPRLLPDAISCICQTKPALGCRAMVQRALGHLRGGCWAQPHGTVDGVCCRRPLSQHSVWASTSTVRLNVATGQATSKPCPPMPSSRYPTTWDLPQIVSYHTCHGYYGR